MILSMKEDEPLLIRVRRITFGVLASWLFAATLAPLHAQQKLPVRVAMGDVSINKVPHLVALDSGLFDKHGLDVTLRPFSEGAAEAHGVPTAVLETIPDPEGEWDMSVGGGAPGLVSRANQSEPSDDVIIATTDHVVHWHVVAREGIETIEDLKGKRIGISSYAACAGIVLQILADRMGWDVQKDVIALGGDYSVNPLKNGWVDAFIAYDVPLSQALMAGYRPMDIDMRSWNEPYPCNGIWASKSWAHSHKETVMRYLKALTEAISLMKKDKTYAFRSMAKWYGFTDVEQQQVIYNGAADMPRAPYPAVEGIKRVMALPMYQTAAIQRFKPEDFYDDSFMRELEESGFIDALYE
jgi:NitT/TauT family transport system substrate-binding protein